MSDNQIKMKINIKKGRIIRIEEQELNPVLPTTDLSFIEDKDLYKEIRNYIKNDHPTLENKLVFQEGVMKYSNTYLATAVDMFFKNYHPKYRLATQANLETDLSKFKGFYIDSGLALRNLTGTNKEQAEYLFKQLKSRGIKESNFPLWINLRGLELGKNLNFNLTDESFYKTAKSLNWKNGTRYSETDDFGLPKKPDKNSNRQIWTNSNYALSRAYLDRDGTLNSRYDYFAGSYGIGRVVVARIA